MKSSKKKIVYYYSKTGNNKFIANKIAKELNCEIEEIQPRINLKLINLSGIKPLKSNPEDYDLVILCGPIWMGKLIYPLTSFIDKHSNSLNQMVFISCCGSSYEQKDDKFGHNKVFATVQDKLHDKCIHYEAFPIPLIIDEEKRRDGKFIMETRLSDNNFDGEIKEVFILLIDKLKRFLVDKEMEGEIESGQ
jgi:flavodoxin